VQVRSNRGDQLAVFAYKIEREGFQIERHGLAVVGKKLLPEGFDPRAKTVCALERAIDHGARTALFRRYFFAIGLPPIALKCRERMRRAV
jgi:hypothetical protein